jgi:hypothetical protein
MTISMPDHDRIHEGELVRRHAEREWRRRQRPTLLLMALAWAVTLTMLAVAFGKH